MQYYIDYTKCLIVCCFVVSTIMHTLEWGFLWLRRQLWIMEVVGDGSKKL